MTRTYTFYSDPGHAWLAVPIKDLQTDLSFDDLLKLSESISRYSYIDRSSDMLYLEEDSDAGVYLDLFTTGDNNVVFHQEHEDSNSFIRELARYGDISCKLCRKRASNSDNDVCQHCLDTLPF